MTNTQTLMLSLIGGELRQQTAALECLSDEEAASLFALSKFHEMAHLVAAALKRAGVLPDGEVGQSFRKEMLLAAHGDESKTQELEALHRIFSEEKIPFLPLKGAVLRKLYPESWMRTRCDIDVLVKWEDLVRASERLKAEGYDVGIGNDHDVSIHTPRGIHLELHYTLHADGERINPPLLKQVWEYASPTAEGSYEYALSDAMLYFTFLAHTAKHVYNGGCGIRPLADLWLLRHSENADVTGRRALAEEGGLAAFDETIGRLAEAWFGDGPFDDAAERFGDYILNAGVYGSMANRTANWGGDTKGFYLKRIFCSYKTLCGKYPKLDKRPYLFPLYQVIRWKDLLFDPARVRAVVRHRNKIEQSAKAQTQGIPELMKEIGLGE